MAVACVHAGGRGGPGYVHDRHHGLLGWRQRRERGGGQGEEGGGHGRRWGRRRGWGGGRVGQGRGAAPPQVSPHALCARGGGAAAAGVPGVHVSMHEGGGEEGHA